MKFFPICEFNYISNMAQANFKKLGEIDHFGSIRLVTLTRTLARIFKAHAHARARAGAQAHCRPGAHIALKREQRNLSTR